MNSFSEHKNLKGFITHGGMMGGIESILSGVPMIGFPLFADQMLNLENLVQRNIAISLNWKTINGEELTSAISNLCDNPIYRYMC